jgi:hypothetical protein
MAQDRSLRGVRIVALLGFLVAACATGSADVSEGVYTEPHGLYSLPVPSGIGMRVQEDQDDQGSRVSFNDDFGGLSAITCWRLPSDYAEVLGDPQQRDDQYAGFFNNEILPGMFQPASPEARVLHAEFVGKPGAGREYFAVVDLPGASPIVVVQGGKESEPRRLDSVRAVLVFETGGFLYMLEREVGEGFVALGQPRPFPVSAATPLDDPSLAHAREGLHTLRRSIRFSS